MKWREVDLANQVWTIPAERTKTNQEHRVPLSDRAVELLTKQCQGALGRLSAKLVYVWTNRRDQGHISTKALYVYLIRSMKVPVTIHGFRSTFRDWAGNETSFDRVTCELALGHQAGDATELAYRRSDALAKRRALMDAWASYCEGRSTNSQPLKTGQGARTVVAKPNFDPAGSDF